MLVRETCGASYTVRAPNLLAGHSAAAERSLRWAVVER